jgi:hypothetical protein
VRENDQPHLVGGLNPSEKDDFVSWDDDIPNTWKKCSKQHTSIQYIHGYQFNHSKLSNRDAGWISNEAQSEKTLT